MTNVALSGRLAVLAAVACRRRRRALPTHLLMLGASLLLVPTVLALAVPTTAPAGPAAGAPAWTTPSSTAPAARTATASAPATRPTVIRTMIELLAPMPRELRPDPKKGWDKYTAPKAMAWIQQRAVGQRVEMSVPFSSAMVLRLPLPPDKTKPWQVYVYFRRSQFQFAGTTNVWSLANFSYQLDDAGAKRWEAYKGGHLFRIKGTIAGIEVKMLLDLGPKTLPSPRGYEYVLRLKDVELADH